MRRSLHIVRTGKVWKQIRSGCAGVPKSRIYSIHQSSFPRSTHVQSTTSNTM